MIFSRDFAEHSRRCWEVLRIFRISEEMWEFFLNSDKNFDRILMWKVRMVRSVADRTSQPWYTLEGGQSRMVSKLRTFGKRWYTRRKAFDASRAREFEREESMLAEQSVKSLSVFFRVFCQILAKSSQIFASKVAFFKIYKILQNSVKILQNFCIFFKILHFFWKFPQNSQNFCKIPWNFCKICKFAREKMIFL